ncbi:single-stranded DNA-binding protein [Sphingobacterium daejeonense]|uniref:single-stranded DNA-binding protein n=1 Tax=Sphingobacterium daejeonense TaxID=371142 RepID=UPI00406B94BC
MNITGRLTRNAEVRTLSNEKQVVNFSVAVNDSYRNKPGRTSRANHLLRLCLLDNSKRGKATDKRHFGRTHRACKSESVGKQRRRTKSRT